MNTIALSNMNEKIDFKTWQDYILEKESKKQHWFNQSSKNFATIH